MCLIFTSYVTYLARIPSAIYQEKISTDIDDPQRSPYRVKIQQMRYFWLVDQRHFLTLHGDHIVFRVKIRHMLYFHHEHMQVLHHNYHGEKKILCGPIFIFTVKKP